MDATLPAGCTWRRPTTEDAPSILAVIAARNVPLLGSADATLADVADELADPAFDLDRDGWVVAGPDGVDVGWGWAYGPGDAAMVDIDVYADGAVAGWLWGRAVERAIELGAERGHAEVAIDIGIYEGDVAQQDRADAAGFAPATTFQRMRIDFDGRPDAPTVPSGIDVRVGPGDESLHRDAHGVWREAFADHFGFVDRGFDEWHAQIDSLSTTDWSQLRVAYVDGTPVAMVRANDQFVEDEGCGYVATVAVVPAARGRGLAKLLLLQAFADDAARGRRGTVLHVDANNVTPAVDLYVGVGMRPVLRIDVWRTIRPTG